MSGCPATGKRLFLYDKDLQGLMISRSKISFVRSLGLKKRRDELGLFVAEGPKVVSELLPAWKFRLIIATRQWLSENGEKLDGTSAEVIETTEEGLRRVSFLQHPQQVLAVVEKKETRLDIGSLRSELTIALDGVRDPGNLGTIIRVADWFGIGTVVCSRESADVYNPKVIQATMGSVARVNVAYADLVGLLEALPKDFPVYGTLLDGDDIYGQRLSENGLIVMGNEGVGISEAVRRRVNRRLLIPPFPRNGATAESLNVGVATAIVCSEFKRNA